MGLDTHLWKTRPYRIKRGNSLRVADGHHMRPDPCNVAIFGVNSLVIKVCSSCFHPPSPLKVGNAGQERSRNVPQAPPCLEKVKNDDRDYCSHSQQRSRSVNFVYAAQYKLQW